MQSKSRVLLLLLGGLILLWGQSLRAATVGVGTCEPGLTHFFTIQSAINASPVNGTIDVCPGTYPEQLSIFKPITIRGVDLSGNDMAVITFPAGGTGTQIYVQATNVNLSNLVVDGANNGVTTCSGSPDGIYYFDSSGVINHVAVRNQVPSGPGLLGCFEGIGILVGSSSSGSNVTIENSTIHSFQGEGIDTFGRGTSVTVKNNSVGGNAAGPGGNGIRIGFGASGTVTGNWVINVNEAVSYPNFFNAGWGIVVECSDGAIVSGNVVGDTQGGIVIGSFGCGSASGNTITGNRVAQTHIFDGIYVCANYTAVQFNTINSSSVGGVHIDTTCDSPGVSGDYNTITNDTVDEACTTVLQDPAAFGNTVGSNTEFAVVYDKLTGTVLPSGTCSLAPSGPARTAAPDFGSLPRFKQPEPPPPPKQG